MSEKPFRILSIDGGGLRGIIPINILQEIEKRTGKSIIDCFDLIAGTSTGGIIACLLTMPKYSNKREPKYALKDIEILYDELRKKVFKRNFFKYNFQHYFFKTRYSHKAFQNLLTKEIGNTRLGDCLKPIYIPTFDLFSYSPYIFKSVRTHPLHKKYNQQIDYFLKDVCRATSAAPTFFLPHEIKIDRKKKLICVDGGVFLNNPAAGALVDVLLHREIYEDISHKSVESKNIYMLSIGTGRYRDPQIYRKFQYRGTLLLVKKIINLMMDGNTLAIEYATDRFINKIYQSTAILEKKRKIKLREENYLRLNVDLGENFKDLDDISDQAFLKWKERTTSQILTDITIIEKLDDFLVQSKLR